MDRGTYAHVKKRTGTWVTQCAANFRRMIPRLTVGRRHSPATLLTIFATFLCAVPLVAEDSLLSGETIARHKLVDIRSVDSTIRVNLKYSTPDNFIGENVYGGLAVCYLRREAAEKLATAQRLLKEKRPGYSLLIYDALRPRRIQNRMWSIVKGTPRQPYVANPKTGSVHNFGAAVDLTIVDDRGVELDMGTPFDYFGAKAQPRYEAMFLHPELLKKTTLDTILRKQIEDDLKMRGALQQLQVENRRLMRGIMIKAGFRPIANEWWHFDAFPVDEVRKRFTIVE